MALDNRKKEKIAQVVIKVLYSRFQSFPENANENRNAPFHEAFLRAFSEKLDGRVRDIPDYISLSSWFQGLNTSLGQTFFESVAQILCDGEKRDFKNKEIFQPTHSHYRNNDGFEKWGRSTFSTTRRFNSL